MTFKKFLKESVAKCKYFISGSEECKIGCKEIKVHPKNVCPFEGKPENKECPCYES